MQLLPQAMMLWSPTASKKDIALHYGRCNLLGIYLFTFQYSPSVVQCSDKEWIVLSTSTTLPKIITYLSSRTESSGHTLTGDYNHRCPGWCKLVSIILCCLLWSAALTHSNNKGTCGPGGQEWAHTLDNICFRDIGFCSEHWSIINWIFLLE